MTSKLPAPCAVDSGSMTGASHKQTNSSGPVHFSSFKRNYVHGGGLHLLLSHCGIGTAFREQGWDTAWEGSL